VARTTTITLGGDLQVGRVGYGAMRLTGTIVFDGSSLQEIGQWNYADLALRDCA
jgi:hypothetical protein